VAEDLLTEFERVRPGAIYATHEVNGRKHRDFTRDGKRDLHRFIINRAKLEDLSEVVKLIRALRDYFRLRINHIAI